MGYYLNIALSFAYLYTICCFIKFLVLYVKIYHRHLRLEFLISGMISGVFNLFRKVLNSIRMYVCMYVWDLTLIRRAEGLVENQITLYQNRRMNWRIIEGDRNRLRWSSFSCASC